VRIAVVGGGPSGLYFAAAVSRLLPRARVTVWERDATAGATGLGLVLSEDTLGWLGAQGDGLLGDVLAASTGWDEIDVHVRGALLRCAGHRFRAIRRGDLLRLVRDRLGAGVTVVHRPAPPAAELAAAHDVVALAGGLPDRGGPADPFGRRRRTGVTRYVWAACDARLTAFTFATARVDGGLVQLHAYPDGDGTATAVVELIPDDPGGDGPAPVGMAEASDLFGEPLRGGRIRPAAVPWSRFVTLTNSRWWDGNLVLLGDAAHTTHFSTGQGTRLGMADGAELAARLAEHGSGAEAFAAYEAARQPVVASAQRAARASQDWFERLATYGDQEPEQFAFNLLTRSRRVTRDNLRVRDAGFVARAEQAFRDVVAKGGVTARPEPAPPMLQPVRIGRLELANRVVVSAMDMYSARDGVPADFHLVHLGSRALGGAGLVVTEMTCVSPDARISHGCCGIWNAEQEAAWRRIVGFVHERTPARMALQLGHAGRKGATGRMWEDGHAPLTAAEGAWPLVAPSPLPFSPRHQTPRELTPADLHGIAERFATAASAGARAGFDALELHAAHGYLLSSFISPLTNRRTDEYGGSLVNRLRFPLLVLAAVRDVWPRERPVIVRISATDWHPGGVDERESVAVADALIAGGADALDVSTGQVMHDERPDYGRSYQTAFADRIRNSVAARHGVPVIAVGAISSADDVNSLLLAGRADLCALGRAHLDDPHWTLHAAEREGYRGPGASWPVQYLPGAGTTTRHTS
jgi:anthraniloyl-CoA monooxygenase